MNLIEELALFASIQRRHVLGDISPSTLYSRGMFTANNVPFLHEPQSAASPEEHIIKQRSKTRRLSLPVLTRTRLEPLETDTEFLQITPAKNGKLNQLSRKRLLMSPSTSQLHTPVKHSEKKPKRARLSLESPRLPLQSELQAYSTQQLVSVLDSLVNNHPELEQEVRKALPCPDLKPLEDQLLTLKRSVLKSLPTTRFGSSRDSYCYKRAKPHLLAFKRSCLEQGKLLVLTQSWESVIRYVLTAWKYVGQLPNWDDPSHNAIKIQCYQALATQCMVAAKRGHFEKEVYQDLQKRLKKACSINKEIEPCLQHITEQLEAL